MLIYAVLTATCVVMAILGWALLKLLAGKKGVASKPEQAVQGVEKSELVTTSK